MRHSTRLIPALALALALAQAPTALAATPSDAVIAYEVQAGDTLWTLAQRFFVRPGDHAAVGRLNRVADPRRLRPGQTLRIPVRLLRATPAEARLANFRGPVTVQDGGAPQPAQAGQVVREGAVIATGANAFARLELSDGGHVSLPSQSRVRVARLRTILLTGASDYAFQLEAGRVESGASPVRAPGGFEIRTPISVSAVRGTDFRNAFDPAGARGATEVLTGAVEVEAEDQRLTAGPAQAVVAGPDGLDLAAMPPAPDLLRPDAVQTGAQVRFEVAPVAGAVGYRARLATDAGMVDAFAETEAAQPILVFDEVADGAYFVRLSAVSAEGVEGLPSVYSVLRARTGVGGLDASASGQGADRAYLFRWRAEGEGAAHYRFQFWRADEPSAAPLIDRAGLDQTAISLTALPPATYEWRVRITRPVGGRIVETWSEPQQLRLGR